jgi:hypothetical protein
MQYPPDDPSAARADAAAALLAALRDVRDANERLQFAAAFVMEAFGDTTEAETIRMLPVGGGPARPGKPAVPPPVARSERLTDDLTMLADLDPKLREPLTGPDSVTGDENAPSRLDLLCPKCGHKLGRHSPGDICAECLAPCDGFHGVEP